MAVRLVGLKELELSFGALPSTSAGLSQEDRKALIFQWSQDKDGVYPFNGFDDEGDFRGGEEHYFMLAQPNSPHLELDDNFYDAVRKLSTHELRAVISELLDGDLIYDAAKDRGEDSDRNIWAQEWAELHLSSGLKLRITQQHPEGDRKRTFVKISGLLAESPQWLIETLEEFEEDEEHDKDERERLTTLCRYWSVDGDNQFPFLRNVELKDGTRAVVLEHGLYKEDAILQSLDELDRAAMLDIIDKWRDEDLIRLGGGHVLGCRKIIIQEHALVDAANLSQILLPTRPILFPINVGVTDEAILKGFSKNGDGVAPWREANETFTVNVESEGDQYGVELKVCGDWIVDAENEDRLFMRVPNEVRFEQLLEASELSLASKRGISETIANVQRAMHKRKVRARVREQAELFQEVFRSSHVSATLPGKLMQRAQAKFDAVPGNELDVAGFRSLIATLVHEFADKELKNKLPEVLANVFGEKNARSVRVTDTMSAQMVSAMLSQCHYFYDFAFKLVDIDGSGLVDAHEFLLIVGTFILGAMGDGEGDDSEERQFMLMQSMKMSLLQQVDTDGDGNISVRECVGAFVKFVEAMLETVKSTTRAAFTAFENNKDLTKSLVKEFLEEALEIETTEELDFRELIKIVKTLSNEKSDMSRSFQLPHGLRQLVALSKAEPSGGGSGGSEEKSGEKGETPTRKPTTAWGDGDQAHADEEEDADEDEESMIDDEFQDEDAYKSVLASAKAKEEAGNEQDMTTLEVRAMFREEFDQFKSSFPKIYEIYMAVIKLSDKLRRTASQKGFTRLNREEFKAQMLESSLGRGWKRSRSQNPPVSGAEIKNEPRLKEEIPKREKAAEKEAVLPSSEPVVIKFKRSELRAWGVRPHIRTTDYIKAANGYFYEPVKFGSVKRAAPEEAIGILLLRKSLAAAQKFALRKQRLMACLLLC